MNDAAVSYVFAISMMRFRGILTGEFWPHEDEPFDLVLAAALMRGRG